MTTLTLNTNQIPNQFQQVVVNDSSGAAFSVIAGQPGKYIKVWRHRLVISAGGNIGFSSSGGRVLDPPSGGVASGSQWSVLDFPPAHAFVPWFQTDVSEGLILVYDAGTAKGTITYTVESVQ